MTAPSGRKIRRKGPKKRLTTPLLSYSLVIFKEFNTTNNDMSQVFIDLVIVKEVIHLRDKERAHKLMMHEHKVRAYEDKIMMVDTSRMTPEDVAYHESRKLGNLSLIE